MKIPGAYLMYPETPKLAIQIDSYSNFRRCGSPIPKRKRD
jgi:hypothetical protein